MNITIICPLYNAEKELEMLHKSLLMQENVDLKSIDYVLTKSNDNTEKLLNKINANFIKIEPEEFSHSTVREMMAKKADADIIVFITQDIKIIRKDWLYFLTKEIVKRHIHVRLQKKVLLKNILEKKIMEKNLL